MANPCKTYYKFEYIKPHYSETHTIDGNIVRQVACNIVVTVWYMRYLTIFDIESIRDELVALSVDKAINIVEDSATTLIQDLTYDYSLVVESNDSIDISYIRSFTLNEIGSDATFLDNVHDPMPLSRFDKNIGVLSFVDVGGIVEMEVPKILISETIDYKNDLILITKLPTILTALGGITGIKDISYNSIQNGVPIFNVSYSDEMLRSTP